MGIAKPPAKNTPSASRDPFDPLPLYARLVMIDRVEQAVNHHALSWLTTDQWSELFKILFPYDFSESEKGKKLDKPFHELTREERIELYRERATRHETVTRRYEEHGERQVDFSKMTAVECCVQIFCENGNAPTPVARLVREALSRGYRPPGKTIDMDETLTICVKSFWARLTTDARFRKVKPVVFQLKRA